MESPDIRRALRRLEPTRTEGLIAIDDASYFLSQGRCHRGQTSLPIAVTNHIDVVGGSLNDGITRLRGQSGTRFGSRLITWSKCAARFIEAAMAGIVMNRRSDGS
jgi:hypothetical protein